MFSILSFVLIVAIFGLPLLLLGLPAIYCPCPSVIVIALSLAPFLYSSLFVLTAGLLSWPFQKAIVPGMFARDLSDPLYRARRLYGLCWTCVYYFKPIYFISLSVPLLKTLMFRLFGYRGQMDFTIYPDTWIRDLPLLDFGRGAYIANRVTIGTNMALSHGRILVDRVLIGRNVMVGHLAVVAPGATLEDDCEVGTKAAIGIKCRVGRKAVVQPGCILNHKSQIGEKANVGGWSYIGLATKIGAGVTIPTRAVIPNRTIVESQQDADSLASSRVGRLPELLVKLHRLSGGGGDGPAARDRLGRNLRRKRCGGISRRSAPTALGLFETSPRQRHVKAQSYQVVAQASRRSAKVDESLINATVDRHKPLASSRVVTRRQVSGELAFGGTLVPRE